MITNKKSTFLASKVIQHHHRNKTFAELEGSVLKQFKDEGHSKCSLCGILCCYLCCGFCIPVSNVMSTDDFNYIAGALALSPEIRLPLPFNTLVVGIAEINLFEAVYTPTNEFNASLREYTQVYDDKIIDTSFGKLIQRLHEWKGDHVVTYQLSGRNLVFLSLRV